MFKEMKGEKEDNNFFEDIKRATSSQLRNSIISMTSIEQVAIKTSLINTKIKLLVTKEGIEKKQGLW